MLITVIAGLIITAIAVALINNREEKFAIHIENEDARNKLTKSLLERNISYTTETDHLGRTWVVPDQRKKKEYDLLLESTKASDATDESPAP
ncbi:hypothetical protein LRS11_16255 [Pseudomonas sp. J452]|uniref:hypothetical protein n=1 Tax=Pseudomonas sp. J452 TaxID=2898441 RepID=UPI0021AE06E9|nr:hypothetical protein [Pseudomonas sp. J452]UUY07366.1 hypothetical protein LRS11_16255 [Pseudomonas sp. J452]